VGSKKTRLPRVLGWVAFIIYLIGLSYFLFFSEQYGRRIEYEEYRYNLVLFRQIMGFVRSYNQFNFKYIFINIFGNILIFTPFGFGIPILIRNADRFIRVLAATLLFSLLIETIQLTYKVGCFDVDDLLLNTVGGVLGFVAYRVVRKVVT